MKNVTSGKSIGLKRFKVITEYVIKLSELLENYDGKFKDQKIIRALSPKEKEQIRSLGTSVDDIVQAELIEKYAHHDTASATDLIKIKIAKEIPALGNYIEAVHFANTSEDIMGNVFGLILNELIYEHVVPNILNWSENMINFVKKYEETGPLILPGLTHKQAAEPTTLGKKILTRIRAIDYSIRSMMDNSGEFIPFSGKLGGAIGNLTTHYAAYPDIKWESFAKDFVEGFNLTYEEMTDQSVSYVVEATQFAHINNILTQIIKLSEDFRDYVQTPAQFFVKTKVKGQKGSSVMPNKTNLWAIEGALKMLKKTKSQLAFYMDELPTYSDEGDMGRSYLLRSLGDIFMPMVIGLKRISRETNSCHPDYEKINAFFEEYPGMSGSSIQTVMKRARVKGDAYRVIEKISINSDGTYANSEQFKHGLEEKMDELNLSDNLKTELRSLLIKENLVKSAHNLVTKNMKILDHNIALYRNKLIKYKTK